MIKEFFKKFYEKYSSWIIAILIVLIIGLVAYFNRELQKKQKEIDEIEYTDTTGTYHKIYYEKKFKELKKENRELYDSLKKYKDKIDYIVQFYHEKEYNTGQVHTKPNIIDSVVYDTIPYVVPPIAKTYEYLNEPNDTFQYKLNVNSFTEPNWYSIQAKIKNKFTIVNKEEGGANHITIKPENGGTITDPTVWKKKEKRSFLDRFSFGPGVTAGYDPINKKWGIMVGASATFDLK
jgi:hypothetical protein